MRIEVNQLPPIECSPNWRGHWAQRHQAARIYQEAVFYSCVDVRNRLMAIGEWQPFNRVRIDLTFVYPVHRRRDRDNLIAMFKPGLDGIIAAGLVADDDAEHVEIGQVDILVDPERAPLTVIDLDEIKRLGEGSVHEGMVSEKKRGFPRVPLGVGDVRLWIHSR